MADLVFNIAKGAAVGMLRATGGTPPGLGWNVGILVLRNTIAVSDTTLRDLDTVAAILGVPYSEAAASGYARKAVTNAGVQSANGNLAPNDGADLLDLTLPSQTWTDVAAGETWTKLIVYAEPTSGAADSNRVPLTSHDFTVTTDGSSITWSPASGVYRAT